MTFHCSHRLDFWCLAWRNSSLSETDRLVGHISPLNSCRQRLIKKKASIERVLSLNPPTSEPKANHEANANGLVPKSASILNEDGEPIWKVLVFDNLGRDIISSVLRVNDLRSRGVTIHLYVGSPLQTYTTFRAEPPPGTSTPPATRYLMFLFST